jgi:hypothetical protein
MQFIDHFERRFAGMTHEQVAASYPSSWRDFTLPTGKTAKKPVIDAYVDGSRWVADCPNPLCTGAEVVNFETGLFFCCECRNAHVNHDYIKVRFPNEDVRQSIEAALLERPDWRVRGWRPTETVAGLKRENKEHGL